MGLVSRFETWFGATRADVTVALVLSSISIVGFTYMTFFSDGNGPLQEQRALFELVRAHDSLLESMRDRRLHELQRSLSALPAEGNVDRPTASDTSREDSLARADDDRAAEAYDRVEHLNDRPSTNRSGAPPSGPVNINTASRSRLMDLPGIGEKTAEKIIERRQIAPFRRPEEIMEVKGIGEKKFEKMRKYVVVQ